MNELWRYECQTCGNGCLVHWEEGRPMVCHPKCPIPDWKLLKTQVSYKVSDIKNGVTNTYEHPLGEV